MPIVRLTPVAVLEARILEAAAIGVAQAAELFATEASAAAPVDSGDLRAGIRLAEVVHTPDGVEAVVSTGQETDDYAIVQEVGAWENFRGKYGYVAVKRGNPGYMGDTAEVFGPVLEEYVRAAVSVAL